MAKRQNQNVCFFQYTYISSTLLILLGRRFASPNILLQPSGFDQNTVGQRQDVICSISVPPDVDPDTIELGWLNEDDIITDDGRVTIVKSSTNFSTSVITTIIQFDPLFEDDEGTYSCYLLTIESEISTSIQLQNFRSEQVLMLTIFVCMYITMYSLHECSNRYLFLLR